MVRIIHGSHCLATFSLTYHKQSPCSECGITNSLDGSEDDVVYESTEDANELNLDDSFMRELFASDSIRVGV